jgi:hypothetical protein
MSTYTSEPGTRLGGRYRLEDRVAATAGWSAWKAIDEILARPVSVITFAAGFPRFEQVVTAARAASRLTDTRLMQVFDVEDSWDHGYVVLEWPVGDTLADLLAGGPVEPVTGARIMAEAAGALSAAHAAGLAHLCLRPDAVRWTVSGGVKVTGLGIEAALEGITAEDPELADTEGLGQLLYAALTGLWPGPEYPDLPSAPTWEGQPRRPRQVRAGVPAVLDDITCRALSLDGPDGELYRTPADLGTALRAVLPPAHVPAASTARREQARQQSQRQEPPRSRADRSSGYEYSQYGASGPAGPRRRGGRVAAIAVAALVAIVGISFAALNLLNSPKAPGHPGIGRTGRSTTSSPATSVVTLTPVAAHGFDALNPTDSGDENSSQAPNVLDGNPAGWTTQFYQGSPFFGGLKKGTGLILTMSGTVTVHSITVQFGSIPGADVQIKVGDSNSRSAANVDSMTTIASATNVSGAYTFRATTLKAAKYVVIWFTKLPPMQGGHGRYQAQVFSVAIKGTN